MILDKIRKYEDTALLIARIGVGITFAFIHGLPKLLGGPEAWKVLGSSMTPLGITVVPEFWGLMAGLAEFIGGLFLILGLFFRPATIFLMFTMLIGVVYLLSGHSPWNSVTYPYEMFFFFVLLLAAGPGRYSLDYLLFGRAQRLRLSRRKRKVVMS